MSFRNYSFTDPKQESTTTSVCDTQVSDTFSEQTIGKHEWMYKYNPSPRSIIRTTVPQSYTETKERHIQQEATNPNLVCSRMDQTPLITNAATKSNSTIELSWINCLLDSVQPSQQERREQSSPANLRKFFFEPSKFSDRSIYK